MSQAQPGGSRSETKKKCSRKKRKRQKQRVTFGPAKTIPVVDPSSDSGIASDSDPEVADATKVDTRAPATVGAVAARRAGGARVAPVRANVTIDADQARILRMSRNLYSHTILAPVEVDGIPVKALFDSGAANFVINPRLLAAMPNKKDLDVLDYSYHYRSAAPDAYMVSQGCVTVPVTFKQYTMPLVAVIADCDFPLIIGADFLIDNKVHVHFRRKGGYFQFGGNKASFPLLVES